MVRSGKGMTPTTTNITTNTTLALAGIIPLTKTSIPLQSVYNGSVVNVLKGRRNNVYNVVGTSYKPNERGANAIKNVMNAVRTL